MSSHRVSVAVAVLALVGCFRELDAPRPGHEPGPTQQPPPPPPPPPMPACDFIYLGIGVPILATATTLGAPSLGGCGATGPGTLFDWTAPRVGPYTVSVAASFPLDVDVADGEANVCLGPTVGCAADDGVVSFTTFPGHAIHIAVIARDGVGGPFEMSIDGPAPTCGDGSCDLDEDCSSCAVDCGECASSPSCGDGTCDLIEDCSSCAVDCGECAPTPTCGDFTCDFDEDCSSCAVDCGECAPPPYCGDGTCDLGEDCSTCDFDCGTCPEAADGSR